MKRNAQWWNLRKANKSRKWLKTKKRKAIKRPMSKFDKTKLTKSNNQAQNQK